MDTLSLQDAAQMTGLSPQTLKLQAARGRLAARKVGGVWVTTIEDVIRYVASRRINASDVQVVCRVCGRNFFTPSEAARAGAGPMSGLLVCPDCGSPRMAPVAAPKDPYGEIGHRLAGALRRALADGQGTEEAVNDLTQAFVSVRVYAGETVRVEFDVDRGGAFDERDARRLRDHVRSNVGDIVDEAAPRAVFRYQFDATGPKR